MEKRRYFNLAALALIVLLIPFAVLKYYKTKSSYLVLTEPYFVGAASCISCHQNEHELWLGSHHAKAMAVANDSTVLGDFDNAEYVSNGTIHKFYKRDNAFYVFTKGENGEMKEYSISHTFGYTPLQQYLIPFERGKFQCLPIAWDTEKKEWFDMGAAVYGGGIHHDDWLYWTNQAQNWNGMCAECHSTNLQKNYHHELDSFSTSWSEINVSCEACHGPASEHIKWAALPDYKKEEYNNSGLVVLTNNIDNQAYVDLCARCHSRRSQLGDYQHGAQELMDFMIPTLLHEDYFADGQILDEDYVWGSFTQSKMYHTDIKCNDCHNVHSGERHLEGNALCLTCHQANYYGTAKHHFHESVEGSSCVNCHMPGRYYMGNDFRNDHSIRIPRPDLSKKLGVPNACNQCHTDKSVDWAISYTEQWYGKKERPHYGEAIALGRSGNIHGLPLLLELINDELSPTIVRATALELMRNYSDSIAAKTISSYLTSSEAMLRHSAVKHYSNSHAEEYIRHLAPLLNDPVKAIRIEAALKFSILPNEAIPEQHKSSFERAKAEFIAQNEHMADFPGGRSNLGLINMNLGNIDAAIKHYEQAIEIDKQYYPAYINLALAYNQVGRNREAEKIYKELLDEDPNIEGIHYSLGLLLVELKEYDEAIQYLELATEKDPKNSRINYNLGLLLMQLNQFNGAEKHLLQSIKKAPQEFDSQYALAHLYLNWGQNDKAKKQLEYLKQAYPQSNEVAQMYQYLRSIE